MNQSHGVSLTKMVCTAFMFQRIVNDTECKFPLQTSLLFWKKSSGAWSVRSSMIEYLFSMYKSLGSIPSTGYKKKCQDNKNPGIFQVASPHFVTFLHLSSETLSPTWTLVNTLVLKMCHFLLCVTISLSQSLYFSAMFHTGQFLLACCWE